VFREEPILPPDEAYDPDNSDQWELTVKVSARIISVIQAGDVPNVVLGFDANDDPAQSWLDIHSLLRIDGTWKIINESATHATRADRAGLGAHAYLAVADSFSDFWRLLIDSSRSPVQASGQPDASIRSL